MRWLTQLRLRIRSLLLRSKIEHDLDQELQFHIAEQKAEFLSQGMTDAEAESAARRSFGNSAAVAEQCRDQRQTRWIEDLSSDARFALRTLGRSPGFTVAAVATLALGIGANMAFFSAAYGVLFRPLPYPEPDRLVELELGFGGVGPTTALRDLSTLVDYAGFLSDTPAVARLNGEAVRLRSTQVTWNLARVLGVKPFLGRWFESRDEIAGQMRVVVLSSRIWQERFGADPNIVGRQFLLNDEPHEIAGVMPPDFAFPAPLTDVWTPVRIDTSNPGYMWGGNNLWPIGRLRAGTAVASGESELRSLVERIRPMFPWRMPDVWGRSSRLVLHHAIVRDSRPKLVALALASLLLLVIACGNAGNLLLAKWLRRGREFAVREALGAGRGRLLRQIIAENLVLAGLGAAAGSAVAWTLIGLLPLLLGDVPRIHDLDIAPKMAFAVALAMAVTFGLLTVAPMLQSKILGGRVVAGGRGGALPKSTRLSLALAGLQLAMATALLIGAGLMARTLWQLANVDSGIRATQAMTGTVSIGPGRCAASGRCWTFLQDLGATLAGVPGVRSVNWSNGIPLTKPTSAVSVDIEDHPRDPGAPAYVLWNATATPGYFSALGISLRAGRYFTPADTRTSLPVAIISESTAKRFWPSQSALGKTIRPVSAKAGRTVVGIVSDVKHYSLDGYPPWIDGVQYAPFEQAFSARSSSLLQLSIFVETVEGQRVALDGVIRQRFPDVAVSVLEPVGEVRRGSVSNRRSTAWLLSLLASLGLLLGIIGVHGVLAQRAALRSSEMGIRVALGASRRQIAKIVLREALLVALAGSTSGVVGALVLSRFLRSLLFGIAENDFASYAGGAGLLIVTALLSAAAPAYRASLVDPARTLRSE
ncbi:MAG: ADOP family duplicated permease [Bryobacteraceae bacterium]